MIRSLRQTLLLATGIIASSTGSAVFGQGNTFNPYGNSGYADYREFTTPMYSNDPSLPGQARLQSGGIQGRNRANQFESYVNSMDGSNADQFNANRGVSTGLPYYRAYGLYDKENKRAYRPNDTAADRLFQSRLNERNAAYTKALEEKDPRRRALMLQRLDQDTVNRPLGGITNQSAAKSRTPKASAARTSPDPATRRAAPNSAAPRPTAAAPAGAATSATTPPSSNAPPPSVNPSNVPITAPR